MMAVSVDAVCVEAIGLHRPSMRGIALSVCSLDQPLDRRDPGVTMGDLLQPVEPTQDAAILAAEVSAALDRAIAAMPASARTAMRARFRDGLTLEAAGDLIGVSRERIRQLEALTITAVRARLGLIDRLGPMPGPHQRLRNGETCVVCGRPLDHPQFARCRACRELTREKERERQRERTARYRSQGRCACGKPLEDADHRSCRSCRAAAKRYAAARGTR